jgi:hypothetical protein
MLLLTCVKAVLVTGEVMLTSGSELRHDYYVAVYLLQKYACSQLLVNVR